ncbi:MAG: DUF2079 domain-containing protein [Oscillochloridaceae bacterium umkhey_bin13]
MPHAKPHILPRDPILWLMIAVVGTMLTLLSLMRLWGFNAGMLDLGNMYQAISSVLRGQPLVTSGFNGSFSRLGGHAEFIYLAFVPLVAIWPGPQTLLIGQALLAVAGAIPAYRLAERRLDSRLAARCIALIYLLYPVMQTAVLFDFHGDTLGMPLLMFALDAADRRAWRSYGFWVALALMSKVYVAAPVAGIGFYLWYWGGQRRAGFWTMVAAVIYGVVVFVGVRELFASGPTTGVDEASSVVVGSAALNYVRFYFGNLAELQATLPQRLLSALVVFGPALFIAWRGWRGLVPALPLALAALITTGPGGAFDYRYHHYALVVPFVVLATVEGAARLRAAADRASAGRGVRRWQPDLVFSTVIVTVCWIILVDQPLNPLFWLAPPGIGLDSSGYGIIPRDAVKERFLAEHVPADEPLAASVFLATRLANRPTLYLVRYPDDPGGERLPRLLPQVNYLLSDALFDWRNLINGAVVPPITYEQIELGLALRDPAFAVVAMRDGLILLQRDPPAAAILAQQVERLPATDSAPIVAELGPVMLHAATLTPLGNRRYQASFSWSATRDLPADYPLVPVSQLDGVADMRIVHLPTYALVPTTDWQAGELIRETFVIELPADLPAGSYPWRVGWYDPSYLNAYRTDARSLVGTDVVVGTMTVVP